MSTGLIVSVIVAAVVGILLIRGGYAAHKANSLRCKICGELPNASGFCQCGRRMAVAIASQRIQERIDHTGYCPIHGRWKDADRCPKCGREN